MPSLMLGSRIIPISYLPTFYSPRNLSQQAWMSNSINWQDKNTEMFMSVSGAKNKNSSLASSSLMGMVSSLKVKHYWRIMRSIILFRAPAPWWGSTPAWRTWVAGPSDPRTSSIARKIGTDWQWRDLQILRWSFPHLTIPHRAQNSLHTFSPPNLTLINVWHLMSRSTPPSFTV